MQPSDFGVGRGKREMCLKKLQYKISDHINKAKFERIMCKITRGHKCVTEMVIYIEKFIRSPRFLSNIVIV